jgi:hypothetical protein
MPRFLRRIFADNMFRRDETPLDDLQRTRRVLIRSSTSSTHRLSFFDTALQAEEDTILRRGGTSVAGSSNRPILAPSLADHEPTPKTSRARRRLSKKQRKST